MQKISHTWQVCDKACTSPCLLAFSIGQGFCFFWGGRDSGGSLVKLSESFSSLPFSLHQPPVSPSVGWELKKKEMQKRKILQDRKSWGWMSVIHPHRPHTNPAEGKTVFTVGPRWNWFAQSHLIPECDICPHRKTTGYNVSDIIPSEIAPPNDIIIHPKWGCHHWAVISKCSWNRFYRTRDLRAKRRRSHEAEGVSSDIHIHTTVASFLAGNFVFSC